MATFRLLLFRKSRTNYTVYIEYSKKEGETHIQIFYTKMNETKLQLTFRLLLHQLHANHTHTHTPFLVLNPGAVGECMNTGCGVRLS